ncbi:MAG: hypothetical protein QOE54_98 [Streptosporangiaceae bacterium]|jgi:hypothetical protein|nr:hypothetical protein [Streptosporangiaceae bacterium]
MGLDELLDQVLEDRLELIDELTGLPAEPDMRRSGHARPYDR